MKKYYLLAILLMATYCISLAQNEKIEVEEAPSDLPEITSGWKKASERALNNINLFYVARNPNYFVSDLAAEFNNYKGGLVAVLNSKNFVKTFYDWISPSVKKKWNGLNYMTKAELMLMIKHSEAYLANIDVKAEDAYLEACKKIEGRVLFGQSHVQFHRPLSAKSYFIRWDRNKDFYDNDLNKPYPEYATSPYRRLETFFYRRIKDGVKVEALQYLVRRLKEDMKLPENGTYQTKDKKGNILDQVSFRDGALHGVCKTFKWGMVADSGRYEMNQKEGKWVSRAFSYGEKHEVEDEAIEEYKKGRLISRQWTSYWSGKVSYTIWFDMKKQKFQFKKGDAKEGTELIENEGHFFEK